MRGKIRAYSQFGCGKPRLVQFAVEDEQHRVFIVDCLGDLTLGPHGPSFVVALFEKWNFDTVVPNIEATLPGDFENLARRIARGERPGEVDVRTSPEIEAFVGDAERAMYPFIVAAYRTWRSSKLLLGAPVGPEWARAAGPDETLDEFGPRASRFLARMPGGRAAFRSLGGQENWAVFVTAALKDEDADPELD